MKKQQEHNPLKLKYVIGIACSFTNLQGLIPMEGVFLMWRLQRCKQCRLRSLSRHGLAEGCDYLSAFNLSISDYWQSANQFNHIHLNRFNTYILQNNMRLNTNQMKRHFDCNNSFGLNWRLQHNWHCMQLNSSARIDTDGGFFFDVALIEMQAECRLRSLSRHGPAWGGLRLLVGLQSIDKSDFNLRGVVFLISFMYFSSHLHKSI